MTTASAASYSDLVLPTWRCITELHDLVEIFEPGIQICSWQRSVDRDIDEYLAALPASPSVQGMEILSPGNDPQLSHLPGINECKSLIEDLANLREILQELLGCDEVGMRFARVNDAMCPGWHFDRVGIRLICTYQGPGTQWLDDQSTERETLYLQNIEHGSLVQADRGDVVLLKGSLWQGNKGFGAIHRSPELEPGAPPRTVVTLDPLWND
ncbi:MAG: DUF1826 domain-containing protein [Pseudomonadota bacterium]